MKENYQLKMEEIISKNEKKNYVPTLLLHACCAPCSSYVLEYLSNYFRITVFYYNPNISSRDEYEKRLLELKKFLKKVPTKYPVSLIEGEYEPFVYEEHIKGYEEDVEGGKRCYLCYNMRLEKTSMLAKQLHFDYFTTTLSISPYKNADWLNEIGEALEQKYYISYLYADFKKKGGYQRSIQLSSLYQLYRQDYCGCIFSFRARQKQKNVI